MSIVLLLFLLALSVVGILSHKDAHRNLPMRSKLLGHHKPRRGKVPRPEVHQGICREFIRDVCPQPRGLERQSCIFDNLNLFPEECIERITNHHPLLSCASSGLLFCQPSPSLFKEHGASYVSCLISHMDELSETCQKQVQQTAVYQCQEDAETICPGEFGRDLMKCMRKAFFENELEENCQKSMERAMERRNRHSPGLPEEPCKHQDQESKEESDYYGYGDDDGQGCSWGMILGGFSIAALFMFSVIIMVRACVKTRRGPRLPNYAYVPPAELSQPLASESQPDVLYRYGQKYIKA